MRKVASLQSVVSCGSHFLPFPSLHSSLISIRTFNQNSTQNLNMKKKKKKNKVILVCVWSEGVSCLLFSSKFDGLASTSPGATWLRIHPVYIAADYLPTVFYFCVCQQNSPTQKTEIPHNVQQGAPNLCFGCWLNQRLLLCLKIVSNNRVKFCSKSLRGQPTLGGSVECVCPRLFFLFFSFS